MPLYGSFWHMLSRADFVDFAEWQIGLRRVRRSRRCWTPNAISPLRGIEKNQYDKSYRKQRPH